MKLDQRQFIQAGIQGAASDGVEASDGEERKEGFQAKFQL